MQKGDDGMRGGDEHKERSDKLVNDSQPLSDTSFCLESSARKEGKSIIILKLFVCLSR